MTDPILIVEDEPDLATLLAYNLEREGYATVTAHTVAQAREIVANRAPRLVLLDLMLPDVSGTEYCQELRRDARTSAVPVIIISARGDEIDRVVGFEVGADDYVVKPFSPREVVLRVRALLKRSMRRTGSSRAVGVLRCGPLTLDPSRHAVTVDGEDCGLTALEFRLLQAFMREPGRVRSRDELLDSVWGVDIEVTNRTVDTHVKRLREKLGSAGSLIETVRGVGYRFTSD